MPVGAANTAAAPSAHSLRQGKDRSWPSRASTISAPRVAVPFTLPAPSKSSSATTAIRVLKSKKSRPSIASARTRQMPKPMPQPRLPSLLSTMPCRSWLKTLATSARRAAPSSCPTAPSPSPPARTAATPPWRPASSLATSRPTWWFRLSSGATTSRPHSRNTTRAKSCCPRALSPATTSTRSKVSTCRFGSTAPALTAKCTLTRPTRP